jgi:hypothetical protein
MGYEGAMSKKAREKERKSNKYVISHLEVAPNPEGIPGLPRSGFDEV